MQHCPERGQPLRTEHGANRLIACADEHTVETRSPVYSVTHATHSISGGLYNATSCLVWQSVLLCPILEIPRRVHVTQYLGNAISPPQTRSYPLLTPRASTVSRHRACGR